MVQKMETWPGERWSWDLKLGFVIVIQRRGEVRSWERGFWETERQKSLDSGRRRGIDVKKENRQGDRNTERRGAGFCRERVL